MQTVLDILTKAGGWHPGLSLRIENPPYMDLFVEAMDESGPLGLPALMVAHYRDGLATPEIGFELVLGETPRLHPFYYRHDVLGIARACRGMLDGAYCEREDLLAQYQRHTETWDINLRAQGFVERFDPHRHTH